MTWHTMEECERTHLPVKIAHLEGNFDLTDTEVHKKIVGSLWEMELSYREINIFSNPAG